MSRKRKETGESKTSQNDTETADKPATSLGQAAYDKILQWVFERKLTPGAFMSQSEISKLMDIPMQPLRDALKVLEGENMLTIHPRSGIQFRKPDLEFLRDTYQFRTIIETAAARNFAQFGDDKLIKTLIDEHKALIALIDEKGIDDEMLNLIEENEQRFHGAMISNLKNEFVEITAIKLKYYIKLIQLEHFFTPPLVKQTLGEHITILEACARRDENAAVEALTLHFKEALYRHMRMF